MQGPAAARTVVRGPSRTGLVATLDQLRATVALGLVTTENVVTEAGRADAVAWLGLEEAVGAWDR